MEAQYPKGIRIWPKHENAPEWIKGNVSIHLETLSEWATDKVDEKGYIRLDLLKGKDGLYLKLNEYKKMPLAEKPAAMQENDDMGVPF